MLDKLRGLAQRYEKVESQLTNPAVLEDGKMVQQLNKELSRLFPAYQTFQKLQRIEQEKLELDQLLTSEKNASMRALVEEELFRLKTDQAAIEEEAIFLLLPQNPEDDGNAIVEIRAGTGGDEAALFVADLAKMYRKFAEKKRFRVGVLDASPTELGGLREIILQIEGVKAFYFLKNEAGTHRVQRVPTTEAQGRVHTSTVTVAVLPETEEVEEMEINTEDIKVDTYRSQGAGGQHVNTTDSAVRITHIPSGIVVACQEERSQIKNRQKALKYLKAKLFEQEQEKQASSIVAMRRTMVGTGDRSERIRTYNFPQGRISDHRIKMTLYRLEEIIETGDIDEIVDQLLLSEKLEKLKMLQSNQLDFAN